MWMHVLRRRKLLLTILCVLFLLIILVHLASSPGWNSSSVEVSSTAFPLRFTDYSIYQNWSDPSVRIPGPMEDQDNIGVLIDEPDLCEKRQPEVKVVCCIHSAPWHAVQRDFIRHTWGSDQFYGQFRMVTVFFVGRTASAGVQSTLHDESAKHGDIIQMDFDDAYYNLTYKAVTALGWIQRRCPTAEFVLKTDDDVFVDVFKFVRHLRGLSSAPGGDFVYCHVHAHMKPHRDPKSKWFVTRNEYPWEHYPDFCAGMVVYFRARLIPRLLNVTRLVPYLKLDDVYVTGLLRDKAGIRLKDVSDTISLFDGHFCSKMDTPEVFCHIRETQRKWDIWMNLLLAETARLSKGNKKRQKSYINAIYNILRQDVDGFQATGGKVTKERTELTT